MSEPANGDSLQSVDLAVLCPRAEIAALLAEELAEARAENWAPFRGWRGTLRNGGRTFLSAMTADSVPDTADRNVRPPLPDGAAKELRVFVLACGAGARAAVAGTLQLLTTCPGAPIVLLEECLACDPSLEPGTLVSVSTSCAFVKEELYLLHATPTPLDRLPSVAPDARVLAATRGRGDTEKSEGAPPCCRAALAGCCEVSVDFPTQREWLRRKYGFDVIDDASHPVGEIVTANGGTWAAFGLVSGLAGEQLSSRLGPRDAPALYAPAIHRFAGTIARRANAGRANVEC